jgi:hypothetical protein
MKRRDSWIGLYDGSLWEVYVAAAVRACLENDENFTNIMDR